MKLKIAEDWGNLLQEEFNQSYYKELMRFVAKDYEVHTCYPELEDVFAGFNHCTVAKTNVVIIGQDPYHGPNQANGLCFSVKDGVPHPPSLKNIFKEIETDTGTSYPISGNLERWAKQGVLLLNATLTVKAHEAGSHQKKGWEQFTDAVIKKISDNREDVVFLLWGGFAKKKAKLIDNKKHFILESGHPSPLSANRGYWFGNKNFSNCNKKLVNLGKKRIVW